MRRAALVAPLVGGGVLAAPAADVATTTIEAEGAQLSGAARAGF